MNDCALSRALGSYPDREEFQVGKTIVWVKIISDRVADISKANRLFPVIWDAQSAAIAAAEEASRVDIPSFWTAHDKAGTSKLQLSVWGIWINPETEVADYEVGSNHEFDSTNHPGLPEFPDNSGVFVTRSATGQLQASSDASVN